MICPLDLEIVKKNWTLKNSTRMAAEFSKMSLTLLIFCLSGAYCNLSVESCSKIGFNKANLLCSTCEKFKEFKLGEIVETCLNCCTKDDSEDNQVAKKYSKAILEVCTCKFGIYPQIQAFIKSSRPKKYKNLQIRYVKGLDPIIKLYDSENKLADELDIHKWNTESVDEFLTTYLKN